MSKIIFTGGGTAGHYAPNFAVISALKNSFDEIYYIGSNFGPEKQAVKSKNIPYFGVTTVKLLRSLSLKNATIPIKLLKGIKESKKILREIQPDVVFSKGGYVALPVVIAASNLKIPVITHESDVSIGLANKIACRRSSMVLTSFEVTSKKIKGAVAVGTPIRPELFEKRDKSLIIKQFGLDENKKTLLVTGGSQGSVAINQAIEKIAYMLVNRYNIVHVCGKGKLIKSKFKNYHTMEYCSEMEKLYSIADLAVSRAGANTLFELISLKIPTLAIPLPKGNSRGDQVENALYFKDKGLIDLLFEENASPLALYEKIIELDDNSERIKRNCMEVDYSKNAEKIAEILKNYRR